MRTRRPAAAGAATDAATEDARAFFQRRVAGFALLMTCLLGVFLVWRVAATLLGTDKSDGDAPPWYLAYQAVGMAVFAALWLIARARPRSLALLGGLETGGFFLASLATMAMAMRIPYPVRPDFILVLALTYFMVGRAIYVPCASAVTLGLGVVVALPLIGCCYLIHLTGHHPGYYTGEAPSILHQSASQLAVQLTIVDGLWWLVATAIATATSRVIYGLREEVRDARRLGQYTLLEKLGEGGMGVVYRAGHAMLRRPAAVKLLPPSRFDDESLARFEREVQLTALLTHPNTIRVFDYGHTPDGTFYYAMELCEGANLLQIVRRTGPMPPARAIHILLQIAGALAEAHEVGLIHRDIKPANILVTDQGGMSDVVKVLDFGLVKDIGAGGEATSLDALTHANSVAGTPQFMAPEAITTPEKVDGRTDLYALGAVAYFLVTGGDVFEGRTVLEVCSHHLHTAPEPPSARIDGTLPADLEAVILGCLAKSPADRPADARALMAALAACGDAGAWGEADARAWWQRHGGAIRDAALAGSDKAPSVLGEAATLAAADLAT